MEKQKLIPLDLSVISEEVIEILLLDSSTESSLFDEIARHNTNRPDVLRRLLNHPLTPEDTKEFVSQTLNLPVPAPTETEPASVDEDDTEIKHRKTQSLLQRVQRLKMGEKIQLALRGSREIRSILVRDTSREIVAATLKNPKITESEIELLAKQKETSLDIIQTIAKRREWIKNYSITLALISNPKTPVGISLKHIHAIRNKDLAGLEKNKNVPEAVRITAKKLIAARK
jgi:hypothetical protein